MPGSKRGSTWNLLLHSAPVIHSRHAIQQQHSLHKTFGENISIKLNSSTHTLTHCFSFRPSIRSKAHRLSQQQELLWKIPSWDTMKMIQQCKKTNSIWNLLIKVVIDALKIIEKHVHSHFRHSICFFCVLHCTGALATMMNHIQTICYSENMLTVTLKVLVMYMDLQSLISKTSQPTIWTSENSVVPVPCCRLDGRMNNKEMWVQKSVNPIYIIQHQTIQMKHLTECYLTETNI